MPTNPSLLIVPYRYKAAKLYSQLPESGAGDFTVTRSTTATRTNASGLLESVASGVPRLDYQGGGCPALLVEPAATNLLLRSEEFDNASWTKTNVVITANTETAPNGTLSADKLVANNATDGVCTQSFTFVSGTTYTISCYAKPSGFNFLLIALPTTIFPTNNRIGLFDLSNGTVASASQSNIGAVVSLAGNGYYRCSMTITAISSAAGNIAVAPRSSNNLASLGNSVDGVAVWGAQLETGSVATSYIPTVAATQTRNADVISVSSVSGLIGQTQGTIYAELNCRSVGNAARGIFYLSDGSTNNRVALQFTANQEIQGIASRAGVTQGSVIFAFTGIAKIAFAYSSLGYEMYVNGASRGTFAGSLPITLNRIDLGSIITINFLNDRIRAAAIYTSRLSNAELATLTTL